MPFFFAKMLFDGIARLFERVLDLVLPSLDDAGGDERAAGREKFTREFLAPGGTFVTSGIIEGRQDEIEHALKKAGYSIEKHFCEEEWHCFVCSVRE